MSRDKLSHTGADGPAQKGPWKVADSTIVCFSALDSFPPSHSIFPFNATASPKSSRYQTTCSETAFESFIHDNAHFQHTHARTRDFQRHLLTGFDTCFFKKLDYPQTNVRIYLFFLQFCVGKKEKKENKKNQIADEKGSGHLGVQRHLCQLSDKSGRSLGRVRGSLLYYARVLDRRCSFLHILWQESIVFSYKHMM